MIKWEEIDPPKEVTVTFGKGVVGTIAIPHFINAENPYEKNYALPTNKMALILHGQGGHKNYCYQKRLAHKLAANLGIYSLRFDFRGCGDSADNESDVNGRILAQDVEDIQAAAEFVIDGSKNPLKINFTLSSLIAHSRGGVAMFLWVLKQNEISKTDPAKAIIVPNIVNCSTRFRSYTVLDRYDVLDEDFPTVGQTCLRHGEMQMIEIPRLELLDLAKPDLTPVAQLPLDWSVLSIYGLHDVIVPIQDATHWANHLNRGPNSHKLRLIPRADHSFFGEERIESEVDAEDFNPEGLPLNRKKLVNYNYLVVDYILDWLDPIEENFRFISSTLDIGKFPRWKEIDGVSNFRDLGGWKVHKPTFQLSNVPHNQYFVKPALAYRCAGMGGLTSKGIDQLNHLGIKVIFDLRSNGECIRDGIAKNLESAGIERIHAPVFAEEDFSPEVIAMRYRSLMTSWATIVEVYETILEDGTKSFKTIFEYIRDDPQPFVFHCTAGKDRTGVLGMLILLLAGVDKNTIAKEYELTTLGLKPDHPQIKDNFLEMLGKLKAKLGSSSQQIEELISQGRKGWTLEDDGFENMIGSKYEAMLATYELFHTKYGGVLEYFTKHLGFSESDIKKIYENLVESDPTNAGFISNSHLNWDHRSSKPKF